MMMMQAFRSPPVVARRCSRELESADTMPALYYQNQGPMSRHQDRFDVQHREKLITTVRRDEPRDASQVWSNATDDQNAAGKLDTTTTTTKTTLVRNSNTDCNHHPQQQPQHRQEEQETMPSCRSILDCNSSSSAAEVLCTDSDPRGTGVGTSILGTRSQNWDASGVAASTIECYNDADISAACLLMEMSTSTLSYSSGDGAGDDQSEEQPCSSIRVSDCFDHAAPASPPVGELTTELASASSSGRSRDADEEVVDDAVQETCPSWAATYSNTPRPLRIELRTLGKKRIKPRKDERELNSFGMNQEVPTADNKSGGIFDRPTKKRHYKSLRELLGGK